MRKRMIPAPVFLLLLLVAPSVSSAGPIGLTTTASAFLNKGFQCSAVGTETASCSSDGFTTHNGIPYPYDLDVVALADYGSLYASSHKTGFEAVIMSGFASFQDELSITGGAGNAFIEYLFAGHVTRITDGGTNGFWFSHSGSSLAGMEIVDGQSVDTDFLYTSVLLPFVWDTPFPLYVEARAGAMAQQGDILVTGLRQVTLTGIRVFDGNQNPVENFSIHSASGAAYPAVVPEPGTMVTVAGGLLLLWRRHRCHATRPVACP